MIKSLMWITKQGWLNYIIKEKVTKPIPIGSANNIQRTGK